ncbi:MAG TPA: TRAP transporter substrate-binding protein [Stellaceae bacterium]|jgi:TRAP-type C4-dicarboxylate transport system substrate-binding protein|nr:TRAP transporter substrate-binding protein [Stellaceae bacterium]
MKRLATAIFAAAALCALGSNKPASADELKLLFADVVPPGSIIDAKVVGPWAQKVNAEGKGVLSIDVRPGPAMATFENVYDRVLNDVVQVGWEIQAAVGGKFPRTNVVALPMITDDSVASSVAFWRLYQKGFISAEYDQVVPLMLVTLPPSAFHFVKPLKSLDNLNGEKLIVPNKVEGDALTALGGAPLSLPLTDMYPAVQRGTADGTMIAWVAFNPWKLFEVTHYHVDVGFGGAAGMIFMSRAKYNALPPAAKKIIDENSGEALSRNFGQVMADEDKVQREAVMKMPNQTFAKPTAAQLAGWQAKITPVIEQWTKVVPDGAKVLAQFKTELGTSSAAH